LRRDDVRSPFSEAWRQAGLVRQQGELTIDLKPRRRSA
jgi:hypothetical protein